MRKRAIIGIVVVLILLVIVGLFAYSYTHISVSLNDVKFHSIDWATFSWSTLLNLGLSSLSGDWLGAAFALIQGVNLNLVFGLSNNGFLPVYVPDLSYDILVNGISIGKGQSNINVTIPPGQTKEIISFQNIQKSSLSPAINSIVSEKGVMDIKVKGTAYFKLLGINIPIPFESSKQISLYDEIKNKLNSEIQKNKPINTVNTISKSVSNMIDSVVNELFSADDLNLSLYGQTFVDKTYKVKPSSYYYIPFTLQCTASVQGGFIASAALGDNIMVYIVDESDFKKYQNDQKFQVYYQSGKVESDIFDKTLSPGKYYIILSNTYSDFSTKTVQLQAASACQ